jgi:hypothetical protein
MAPGAKYEYVGTTIQPINVPVLDYPISPRENFRRVLNHDHPMWVPMSLTDFNHTMGGELTGLPDLRFDYTERCDWTDLFGCVWEWIPSAGGSMLKPNQKPVLDDITEWEKKIVWPDLSESRIKACCERYMSLPIYHPDKMNYYDFGQGCTERLVAVLGGYTEAMLALAKSRKPVGISWLSCPASTTRCSTRSPSTSQRSAHVSRRLGHRARFLLQREDDGRDRL